MTELKLTFKVFGSGYLILLPTDELPKPYNAIQYGMIDKQVDGFYYWVPDKSGFVGSAFPAWLLHGIANEIDRLNAENKEELDREELTRIFYNERRAKTLAEVNGQKPYSMTEQETTGLLDTPTKSDT